MKNKSVHWNKRQWSALMGAEFVRLMLDSHKHRHVQSIKLSTNSRWQKGDDPAPDLPWSCGLPEPEPGYLPWWFGTASSTVALSALLEYTIKMDSV